MQTVVDRREGERVSSQMPIADDVVLFQMLDGCSVLRYSKHKITSRHADVFMHTGLGPFSSHTHIHSVAAVAADLVQMPR